MTLSKSNALGSIIGQSPLIRGEIEKCVRYASSGAPVLIYGETGTGKELFARAIHVHGPKPGSPFIPVNCGALPAELVESELFGHEAGAFTGANRRQKGLVEQAQGGTLFLDEINSLPIPFSARSCASCQTESIVWLAVVSLTMRMFASSAPQTPIWQKPSRPARSVKTFTSV